MGKAGVGAAPGGPGAAPDGLFSHNQILTAAPDNDEPVLTQELEKDDRCTRWRCAIISPSEHNRRTGARVCLPGR